MKNDELKRILDEHIEALIKGNSSAFGAEAFAQKTHALSNVYAVRYSEEMNKGIQNQQRIMMWATGMMAIATIAMAILSGLQVYQSVQTPACAGVTIKEKTL